MDLETGGTTVLSRLDHGSAGEAFTQDCLAGEFQMATGLLGSMTVRSAGPTDRRPLLTVLTLGLLAAFGLIAVKILMLLMRPRPRK